MANKNDVSVENQNKTYEAWFNANLKKCVWSAVILVVIVAAVIAGVLTYNRKCASFKAELASANAENLEAIVAEDPDHRNVAAARMRVGNELLQQKMWKEAREQFLKISAISEAAEFLRDTAKLSAASCLEQLKDLDAAAKEFAAIEADSSIASSVRSEAGYNAARLMLSLGKTADAEKILQRVAAMEGTSPWIGLSRNTLVAVKNGDFAVPAAKKAGK